MGPHSTCHNTIINSMERQEKPLKGSVREGMRRGDSIRKDLQVIKHRLKAQDMLNKRNVLFTAPTDRMNKIYFWDRVLGTLLNYIIAVPAFFALVIYFGRLTGAFTIPKEPFLKILLLTGITVLIVAYVLAFVHDVFVLYEGYKAYKKLKEEEKQLEE